MIQALKASTPCTDCNQQFHYSVMQFDHIAPKSFDMAQAQSRSVDAVYAEIYKCEIVCANCHAIRTFKRQRRASILSGGKRLQKGEFLGDMPAECTN